MRGRTTRLNGVSAYKQILLTECELNRVQLAAEWRRWRAEMDQGTDTALSAVSLATLGVKAFWKMRQSNGHNGSGGRNGASGLSTLIDGLRLGASIWSALRPR